jgi:hypothetical protein
MRARDNPFRSEGIEKLRYRLQGTTWREFLARLQGMNYRGAIVGQFGCGKTTLLENIAVELTRTGFGVRLRRAPVRVGWADIRFVSQVTAGSLEREILMIDSAEQLGAAAWFLLKWRSRRAAGQVITTHKRGRLATLWECNTSAALLAGLAGELLRCPPDSVAIQAEHLFSRHQGNLREAFREWYDVVGHGGSVGVTA